MPADLVDEDQEALTAYINGDGVVDWVDFAIFTRQRQKVRSWANPGDQ